MAELDKKVVPTEEFSKDDFTFVHENQNVKIHDEALKTKPTTFAKDAFKRFCKNKSSVVGAIIIGILLLGSFIVPLVSPHNITQVQPSLRLLDPKLFSGGTGFWDGCVDYKNQPWDGTYENEEGTYPSEEFAIGKPAGDFESRAVVWSSVKVTDVEYHHGNAYKYASGGYAIIAYDPIAKGDGFFRNYEPFEIKNKYNYSLTINFANFDDDPDKTGLPFENMKNVPVSVSILYGTSKDALENSPVTKVLLPEAKYEGEKVIDLTEYVTNAKCARIVFDSKPDNSGTSYFALKSVEISATSKTEDPSEEEIEDLAAVNERLEDISMRDANMTLFNDYVKDDSGNNTTVKSIHYWQSNWNRKVFRSEIRRVNFRYDKYEEVLGTRTSYTVGGTDFELYKSKGWCTYDTLANLDETFQVTSKKCPVVEINGKGTYIASYDAWTYDCKVVYYKILGYSSMPVFIFGTDANGYDVFTKALNSLKTSLLIAIISSAVCLAVGLVWGSVSGYFGGNVDIVMERITDIINGVPWIVMMTLIILLLGNNVVTFAIALIMTGWIGTATRTRMQFYRFKGREYVLASRTLGASDARLIFKHILPNGLGTIVTGSVLMIPGCIFSEATIAYLGLGLKGLDSFGVLLSDNQQYLGTHPALIVYPAIIISLLMISFNLFGNGLRDALNPALKGEE